MKSKQVQIGSWSEGTCKTEDILDAALDCLRSLDPALADGYQKMLDDNEQDSQEHAPDEDFRDSECASEILQEIEAKISDLLPPYLYWGAHEGDGAYFGVWVSHESIQDDIRSKELRSGEDFPDVVEGTFLHVSDHGNLELYAAENGKWVSLWSCV